MPKITKDKDSVLTALQDIAHSFNKCLCSVTSNIQSKVNFAHKSSNHFLKIHVMNLFSLNHAQIEKS